MRICFEPFPVPRFLECSPCKLLTASKCTYTYRYACIVQCALFPSSKIKGLFFISACIYFDRLECYAHMLCMFDWKGVLFSSMRNCLEFTSMLRNE